MLKFLLILGLIIYLMYKVGSFLFRLFILGASGQQSQRQQQGYQKGTKRRASKEGVVIDFMPGDKQKQADKEFRGGEYVDYEELKD
ncbi:MAG: hypothetical protein ACI8QD_000052 [Cyclobacteriaceae bacterium]|jgi:hypothetical protein